MFFSLSFRPSYLLTRYAESLGQYAAASQSCNFALRFFHSNQKDVSEKKKKFFFYGLACGMHMIQRASSRVTGTPKVYLAVLASACMP